MSTEPVVESLPSEDELPEDGLIVDEVTDEVLRIHLDKFEGPFEVLLYLIKSQEIDVFDIPIVRVTEQYLRFLDMMRDENLDVAGEFIVMAASLIQIKSRMILPVESFEDDEEDIEEEDPRLELVEKLIEYRKYRDLTALFQQLEEERTNWFTRNVKPDVEPDPEDDYIEATLYDLTNAFKSVLRYITDDLIHTVQLEGASVDEKIARIEEMLEGKDSISWEEIFAECRHKVEIICCFLAILELCRMHRISANQSRSFGSIRLFPKAPSPYAILEAEEESIDVGSMEAISEDTATG